MMQYKDMVSNKLLMEVAIKATGLTINKMDKDKNPGPMVLSMLETIPTVRNMELEN